MSQLAYLTERFNRSKEKRLRLDDIVMANTAYKPRPIPIEVD
jgi:hypothetical protein